jgi:ubiquinone/menaquinone biosynthesis C-methylase UbiE
MDADIINSKQKMKIIRKYIKAVLIAILGENRFVQLVDKMRNKSIDDSGDVNGVGDKYAGETDFWKHEIENMIAWNNGTLPKLYDVVSPAEEEKIKVHNQKDSAILTWHKFCSEVKYLNDLQLKPDAFNGKRIIDIGAGPISGITVFKTAEVYCLDPLYHEYLRVGFPLHYYNARFVHAFSEDMPLPDEYFDAVIAVNSIDHVDDFEKTAQEIKRILKPGGLIAIHAHYHKPFANEPLELNDERFMKAFGWCNGLKKISESKSKTGFDLTNPDESYALWKNF